MLFPTLTQPLKWKSGRDRKGWSRSLKDRNLWRFVPRLEVLEDRTVLSTLTVTSAADDGSAGTLRAVLAAAHSSDTIQFAGKLDGQTITLTRGQLAVNQSVTITGPGASNLSISGNAATRIFDVSAGITVTISGLTLKGGFATDGAGILNVGNLTLSKDILSDNIAQGVAGGGLFGDGIGRGGGVENEAGATLAVSHSIFTGNEALGSPNGGNAFGGGIYNEAGTVTIDRSNITRNQSLGANGGSGGVPATLPGGVSASLLGDAGGGGIWNDGGSLTVTKSTLSNNRAIGGINGNPNTSTAVANTFGDALGGGIASGAFFTTATPSLAVAGSTLIANESQGLGAQGGGVAAFVGNVSIFGCAINGNQAENAQSLNTAVYGGGIYDAFGLGFSSAAQLPTLIITESTITGNVALNNNPSGNAYGGGVDAGSVNSFVSSSTLIGNQALGGPGGGFVIFNGMPFYLTGGSGQGGAFEGFGGSLTISGCTMNANLAQGGPGDALNVGGFSGVGGFGEGGGIDSGFQTVALTNCTLSGNQAVGGASTNGGSGDSGGGGGLFMLLDSATISGTTFVNNLAVGSAGSTGAVGGPADGGGMGAASSSLQLSNCMFGGNEALGGAGVAGSNGSAGGDGGMATAGGLAVEVFSTATVNNCIFMGNLAHGGAGGPGSAGGPGGAGGIGMGGGLNVSFSSTAAVNNIQFLHDVAQGGAGGAGDTGGAGGGGGAGQGGALANTIATTTVDSSSFVLDVAQGGSGGACGLGGVGGVGGDGQGGAVYNALEDGFGFFPEVAALTVNNSAVIANQAVGGIGGAGATGGSGGNGQGGGFFNSLNGFTGQCTLTISGGIIAANAAQGGAGGGSGGNGFGGGIFNDTGATATVLASLIAGNQADGGVAGTGGSGGQGVGGGVYNLGTFFLDAASLIAGNEASTDNDNVFGLITPI